MVPNRRTLMRFAEYFYRNNEFSVPQLFDAVVDRMLRKANPTDESCKLGAEYLRMVDGLATDILNEMHKRPLTDFLGPLYMELSTHTKQQTMGQYFTPQSITDMMAMMSIEEGAWPRRPVEPFRILEPSCGSGANCLSAMKVIARKSDELTQKGLEIVAVDLDPLCAAMAGAQLLWHKRWYMPNIGIAVFQGNGLRPPAEWSPVIVQPCALARPKPAQNRQTRPIQPVQDSAPRQLELVL